MAFPTQAQLAAVTTKGSAVLSSELSSLGISIGPEQIAQVLQMGIDALCMRAWRELQAAGKAAADAVDTEDKAEAAQRAP